MTLGASIHPPLLPSASPGSPDPTNPLYAPLSAAYAARQDSAPLSLLIKLLFRKNISWALIAVMLFTFVGLGIGIGRGMNRRRPANCGGQTARPARDGADPAPCGPRNCPPKI